MDTTPALDAALAADRVIFFICGEISLPGYTLRMIEGSGAVPWSRGTFQGRDDYFGTVTSIDAITDGFGDQAPQLSITFAPASTTAAATLASPAYQNSRVLIWIGAIDPTTKTVITDPYLMFDGLLDQPILSIDKGMRDLSFDCVSSFEKFFRDEEGLRLSDSNQKDTWPGETGLNAVTGTLKRVIWGPGESVGGAFSTDGGMDTSWPASGRIGDSGGYQ